MIIITVECECDMCKSKDWIRREQEGMGDSDIKIKKPKDWIKVDWRVFCSPKCAKEFLKQYYD